ncbi:membrane protein [Actinomycetes bacterium]|nr:membrane protein [Actinomycetes bacterium]
MIWLIAALAVSLIVLGLYLSMTAGRIDRLHQRIETSTLALDAHLLRRSSIAIELATSGVLDPASSLLIADAAHLARTSADLDPVLKAQAESDLTAALDASLSDLEETAEISEAELGRELLDELDAAFRRVQLSRRFRNDAVRACRQVRGQFLVRAFRLAGHTNWPQTWELDDTMPQGLTGR